MKKIIEQLPNKEILTPGDFSRFWPQGKNSIYALFRREDFPAVRNGKRLFVSRQAFLRWLDK